MTGVLTFSVRSLWSPMQKTSNPDPHLLNQTHHTENMLPSTAHGENTNETNITLMLLYVSEFLLNAFFSFLYHSSENFDVNLWLHIYICTYLYSVFG